MSTDYRLLRSSRRKTVSIQVKEGQVVVRAPERASVDAIDVFVRSRADWIAKHQRRQQHEMETLGVRLEQGGSLPWKGEMLSLQWQRGASGRVEQTPEALKVTLSHRVRRAEALAVAEQLKLWFRRQAGSRLVPRAHELAEQTGLMPARIDIGSWSGRWGQCSSLGEVKLNWRLLQLRPELQDYVILHELCHLRHMNHGPEFHALLRQHCQDHPQWRRDMQRYTAWLRW